MGKDEVFEEQKQAALDAAHPQGIEDVVTAGGEDGISPETVELAARLMKKHRKAAYERLEARLKSQQK